MLPILMGLLLGLQHSFEADHIAGITANYSTSKLRVISFVWALGHSLMLLLAGSIFFLLQLNIAESIGINTEVLVGIVLIGISVFNLAHLHVHAHNGKYHIHPHKTPHHKLSFGTGMMHGLAGSGTMVLLFATDFWWLVAFCIGMIVSMTLIGSMLGKILSKIHNINFIMFGFSIGIGIMMIVQNV